MSNHIKPFNQYINESYTEYEEEQLGKDFSIKFGIRAYSTTYSTSGQITIQTRSNIHPEEFAKMIQWVESLGYKVNKGQSYPDFDYDDDRYWYPRIVFDFNDETTRLRIKTLVGQTISDEEMDRMTKIQMDHDEAQLRREQGF